MGFPRIISNNNKVYTKLGEFCLSGDGDHFWIVCHTCQMELQTHNFWEHIQEEHSFMYNTNQNQILVADTSFKTKKQTPSTAYRIHEEFNQTKENAIASPYDSEEHESITLLSLIEEDEIEVKDEPGTDEEYSFDNPPYSTTVKQNEDVASNSKSKRKRKHDAKDDDTPIINSKRSEKIPCSSSNMTSLPGNKAKVDDADDLKKKLIEWNLEHIYGGMSSCGVTIDRLKLLEKDDIDNIFPGREKVGLRAELRERIFAWKNFPEKIAATVTPKSNPTPKSFSSTLTINKGHVFDILQLSNPGKGLLLYYKKNNKLEKENRKVLLNCLIEYYYDSSKNLYFVPKNAQLEQMAEQIVEIFPTESKDVYYISRRATERANPSGLLYNRFNNINRNKRKLSAGPTLQLENFATVCEEAVFDPENDSLKKRMKVMQNVEDESQALWLKTYEYRRNNIRQFEKLTEIFEEWPFFQRAGGEKFIDLDFEMLHPQKKNMLINKWGKFQELLLSYYNKYIKDKQYRLLLEKLYNEKIDKNSKDCISVMLLNTILKPTSRVAIKNEAGKSFKKLTIRDAINSCIMHITSPDALQRTIEDQLKAHTQRKGTIQPYIIAIGSDLTSLTDFYVCIGETLLKFTSFIAAFDICFKAFHVFELQYPKESHLLWLGIQKYIFDVTTIHDIKSSLLAEFLNTIKNF